MKNVIKIISMVSIIILGLAVKTNATYFDVKVRPIELDKQFDTTTLETKTETIIITWNEVERADGYQIIIEGAPNLKNLDNYPNPSGEYKSAHRDEDKRGTDADYTVNNLNTLSITDNDYDEDIGFALDVFDEEWEGRELLISVEVFKGTDILVGNQEPLKVTIDRLAPDITIQFEDIKTSKIVDGDLNGRVRDITEADGQPNIINVRVNKNINFFEQKTIDVVDLNSEIYEYKIVGAAQTTYENYRQGNAVDLEKSLRTIDNSHIANKKEAKIYLYVKDKLENEGEYIFYLDVIGPALPTNKSIIISNIDSDDTDSDKTDGIDTTVKVEWFETNFGSPSCNNAETGKTCAYQLWVNDVYENNISYDGTSDFVNPVNSINYDIKTFDYGSVTNYYEVRAIDTDGNYSVYPKKDGVTEDVVAPFAIINWSTVTKEKIKFELNVYDPNGVARNLRAILYDDQNRQVKVISVSNSVNEYFFNDLEKDTEYKLKIFGYIKNIKTMLGTEYPIKTADSGQEFTIDFKSTVVERNNFKSVLDIERLNSGDDQILVKLYPINSDETRGAEADRKLIRVDEQDDNTEVNLNQFSQLTFGTNYRIYVEVEGEIIAIYNFRAVKSKPKFEVNLIDVKEDKISMEFLIDDLDNAIIDTEESKGLRIEVYDEGKLVIVDFNNSNDPGNDSSGEILINGKNRITITPKGLEKNTKYTIKAYSSYNVLDKDEEISSGLVYSDYFYTAKSLPTMEIKDVVMTEDTLTFSTVINDEDETLKIIKAFLYENGVLMGGSIDLKAGTTEGLKFENLKPLKNYHINVEARYQLSSNSEPITISFFETTPIYRTKKAKPTVEFIDGLELITSDTIDLTIMVTDTNRYADTLEVRLNNLSDGNKNLVNLNIYAGTAKKFEYNNLSPDNLYEIVVRANHVDAEGIVVREDLVKRQIRTEKLISASITNRVVGEKKISFSVDVKEDIKTDVYAVLYLEEVIVEQKLLTGGINSVEFSELFADNNYKISIETTGVSGDKKILTEESITTKKALQRPTVNISATNSDQPQLGTVIITLDDPGFLISGDLILKICDIKNRDECQTEKVPFTRGDLEILVVTKQISLPYNNNEITVTADYIVDEETIKTVSNASILPLDNKKIINLKVTPTIIVIATAVSIAVIGAGSYWVIKRREY